MDDHPCYELHDSVWKLAKMSDGEPSAIVVYATEPSPETGHVGWCWWTQGKMGDAPSLDAAKALAESALNARSGQRVVRDIPVTIGPDEKSP